VYGPRTAPERARAEIKLLISPTARPGIVLSTRPGPRWCSTRLARFCARPGRGS
jgi:hypothetical protein